MISRRYFVLILFLSLLGCNIDKEVNVIKLTEIDNGKTIRVPEGYRLSVRLRGKWHTTIFMKDTTVFKPFEPDKQEDFFDGKVVQMIVVSFAVYGPGKLRFTYQFSEKEFKTFEVNITR